MAFWEALVNWSADQVEWIGVDFTGETKYVFQVWCCNRRWEAGLAKLLDCQKPQVLFWLWWPIHQLQLDSKFYWHFAGLGDDNSTSAGGDSCLSWDEQKRYAKVSAHEAGERPYDVYMGVDVFGRNTYGGGGFQVHFLLAASLLISADWLNG